jgi:BirA family biotin operon repressor/biotin-[acetyl-CoA-carboxylase] ligase
MGASHDRLSSANLEAALAAHPFVTQVEYRLRLGSTNDLAKERAIAGAPEGLLVIAEEQTTGRGRRGRRWWSAPGTALLTSLLFRPVKTQASQADGSHRSGSTKHERHERRETEADPPSLDRPQELGMLCALAAADAVAEVTHIPVELKWPNDLMVRGCKLAGLLAESVFKGAQIEAVIVGLGINVNTDFAPAPDFDAPATSLRLELGYTVDRLPLLISYLDGVARRYACLNEESPYEEWVSRLATLGQHVTVRLGGPLAPNANARAAGSPATLSGLAEGVDAEGALLLRASDGTVHRLLAADVRLGSSAPPQVSSKAAEDG